MAATVTGLLIVCKGSFTGLVSGKATMKDALVFSVSPSTIEKRRKKYSNAHVKLPVHTYTYIHKLYLHSVSIHIKYK